MQVFAGARPASAISIGLSIGIGCFALLSLVGCGSSSTPGDSSNSAFELTVKPSGSGTITSNPSGISCGSTCSQRFSAGSKVTLTATPAANAYFSGWGGACTGMAGCTVMLTTNSTVTASFTSNPSLSVQLAGSGSGSVISTPVGINCGSTCTAMFAAGTPITLTATASTGSTFSGWSGACSGTGSCAVTLQKSASVSASFTSNSTASVTVTLAGGGIGTVTSNPAGINCPTTCSADFPQNSQVTLSATPGTSDSFGGWAGACTGSGTCSITVTGSESLTATFGGSLQSINHIIVFAQENRSFDHYFGALREYWAQNSFPDQSFDGLPQFNPSAGIAPLQGPAPAIPGCDPAQPFPASDVCEPDTSNLITSFHFASVCQEEQSPFWNESHVDWDLNDPAGNSPATLNGFVVVAADDARQQSPTLMDTNGIRAMGYFDGSDLNYYYFMASNFATSDRWFSPVMDRTQINRMYLLAATSAGHAHPLAAPETPLTATTIFEELQNAGISWKIYIDPLGTSCPTAPTPACLYNYSYINQFTYGQTILNSPTLSQNLVPISQFMTDLQNGTLPQVALIEPPSSAGLDEHPSDYDTSSPTDVQAGAQFASTLMNGLMTSSSWKDSALIFTYDEAGGFYDHVSPQPMPSPDGIAPMDLVPGDICDTTSTVGGATCNFTWTGYRIPLIVVSPFARKNFVSHQVRDYTAILKLIETRFNLPALTQRDAAQIDMSEFFDFVNEPWAVPPTPPAQTTSGSCTLTPPTP